MPEETADPVPVEVKKEENFSIKNLIFGSGWKPKISPEMDKVFDRISDFVLYGIIYFIIMAMFVAMQNNEYQKRDYCYAFITTDQCTCVGLNPSILLNRTVAIPNPGALPNVKDNNAITFNNTIK